jgi:hypothetical protein
MKRVVAAALAGIALGVGITSLVFLTRTQRSWQEQEARSEASGLACGLSVGLGATCNPILVFRSNGFRAWFVHIAGPGGRQYCYELRTFHPPLRQPCH